MVSQLTTAFAVIVALCARLDLSQCYNSHGCGMGSSCTMLCHLKKANMGTMHVPLCSDDQCSTTHVPALLINDIHPTGVHGYSTLAEMQPRVSV
jgi:hypothetical protein